MTGNDGATSLSTSTETMSDLEEKTISESSLQGNGEHFGEPFGSERLGSGTESNLGMEEDSEATISEDLNLQDDANEALEQPTWQPSPRLTARQQARQQRLLQGIQQTQWNDMSLPRNLDFSNKNRQKGVLSDEQHLKRMQDAEVRRLRTQKARRDTMENTKARIRAATSTKFKDLLGNGQIEKRKMVRSSIGFLPGRVKIKKSIRGTVLVLPEGAGLPGVLQPKTIAQYQVQRVCEELLLDPDCSMDRSLMGKQVELLPEGVNRVGVILEGTRIAGGATQTTGPAFARTGTVVGIHYRSDPSKTKKIKIRLNQDLKKRNSFTSVLENLNSHKIHF